MLKAIFEQKEKVPKIEVTDIHSHILPGIDDGAKDWACSISMLDIAYKQGIRTIITTPHYIPGHRSATPVEIQNQLLRLKAYAAQKDYNMKFYCGNEIYFNSEVPKLLESREILSLADSDKVLIEFSPQEDYRYIRNSLAQIQSIGYQPILAHAERYECLCKRPMVYFQEVHNMGIFIQVNADTLTGRMGRKKQSLVKILLKKQLVDFLGTDAHNNNLRAPYVKECLNKLLRRYPHDYIEKICFKNAEDYIINK